MLECIENCRFQKDGICTKTSCDNPSFGSLVCPFFQSSIKESDEIVNPVNRDSFYI